MIVTRVIRRAVFTVHPLLTTLLALVLAALAVSSSRDRAIEVGGGRTEELWYLPAAFASGAVSLAFTAWYSWWILFAVLRSRGPYLPADPLNIVMRRARPAVLATFAVLLVGPVVSLVDVGLTGSWAPLGMAIYGGVTAFITSAPLLVWLLWRLRVRNI